MQPADKKVERVFSGIQPSGALTLGNYLGAIRNFVRLQHEATCYFCIVDLHAMTVPQDPEGLYANTLDLARLYLAAGLDPAKVTLFVQSHNPAHCEMAWLMEVSSYVGELRRMTQYKQKSDGSEAVTTGLFTYPCLMAADILLYQTTHVPVGDDQKQHLELTRDIALRINNRFNDELLTVPEPLIADRRGGSRIMSLSEPTKKMSKSEADGAILLLDPPDVVRRKIKRAVTDTGREVRYDEEAKPGVSNLMVILSLCTGQSLDAISARYDGYGAFKKDVAEAVVATLEPLQKRYAELTEPGAVEAVLAAGADRAVAASLPTLRRLQSRLGMVPRLMG